MGNITIPYSAIQRRIRWSSILPWCRLPTRTQYSQMVKKINQKKGNSTSNQIPPASPLRLRNLPSPHLWLEAVISPESGKNNLLKRSHLHTTGQGGGEGSKEFPRHLSSGQRLVARARGGRRGWGGGALRKVDTNFVTLARLNVIDIRKEAGRISWGPSKGWS